MKKLIILFLILTLVLGVFASCNSKIHLTADDETSTSTAKTTITEDNQCESTKDETSNSQNESTNEEIIDSNETNQTDSAETTDIGETSELGKSEYLESYDFVEIDGQHYMVFNSYDIRPGPPADVNYYLTFDSVDEFWDEWTKRTFDYNILKQIVRSFTRTEHGIPVFDPNNFQVPSMPTPWVLGASGTSSLMFLDGQHIKFIGEIEGSGFLTVDVLSEDLFENELANKMEPKKEEFELISNDQKEVYMKCETDLHYTYTMYVNEGDLHYVYVIRVLEPLSHEQLLSFGLTKYER